MNFLVYGYPQKLKILHAENPNQQVKTLMTIDVQQTIGEIIFKYCHKEIIF